MCGGSFMSGIGQQVGSALGGGANPLQNSNTGGGLMGGGMPAPMQNPFLGGQPQGMMPPPPIPPAPQGPGAGPTSQPQTMQDRLARASELLGTRGGGMGQPYISDRGYFGPGTMSNPTGPQFGQEGVITQVSRPLTGVPQYGGGMGQPMSAEDAWRQHSAMALYAPGTDMAKEKQNFIANYNARQGVPQYGGQDRVVTQVARPLTDVPQYGGGMGQPLSRAQLEAAVADDIATGRQIYRGPEGTQILQKLLQGTPSGANGPYPAQVRALPFQPQQISLQQQRMMDRLNQQFGRQMQPYQQQMEQLQQKYMSQPPLQFDQELQKMPEYQAMQKAAQSGNFEEANRLRNAFESSPQFKQFELTRNAYDQQRQQAEQKMLADPRFNQLQNRMQELQRRQQRLIQARQPQPQVFPAQPQPDFFLPAQPRPQVLPSEGLGTGIANLLPGMMF